jgi:hypothetical protein
VIKFPREWFASPLVGEHGISGLFDRGGSEPSVELSSQLEYLVRK